MLLLTGATCVVTRREWFSLVDTQPYGSDDELIHAVRLANGILEMTSAVTRGRHLHPLLDCAFGGAFDRFHARPRPHRSRRGTGMDSISLTSAQPGAPKTNARRSGVWRSCDGKTDYGVNAARSIVGDAPDLRALLLTPSVNLRPNSSPGGSRERVGSRRRWRRR